MKCIKLQLKRYKKSCGKISTFRITDLETIFTCVIRQHCACWWRQHPISVTWDNTAWICCSWRTRNRKTVIWRRRRRSVQYKRKVSLSARPTAAKSSHVTTTIKRNAKRLAEIQSFDDDVYFLREDNIRRRPACDKNMKAIVVADSW